MMLRVLVVVIAGVAVASTSAARVSARSPNPDEKSYADLVAANYRLLSLAESQRLVRFAAAFSSCLGRHGVRLGVPRLTKTLQTEIGRAHV